MTGYPKERVLEDDYPVYAGYLYVADGEPFMSEIEGTVLHLKHRLKAKEIRSCDMIAREGQKVRWK